MRPRVGTTRRVLKAAWLDTPLGPMLAIADDRALYLLEFVDRRGLEGELGRLRLETETAIILDQTGPIDAVGRKLKEYFAGELKAFKTPIAPLGSPFQQSVWKALQEIPYGETRSYGEVAAEVGRPSAARAVAQVNGANRLALIVPCHRVIGADGAPRGYGGGVSSKGWLLEHEKRGGLE